MSDYIERYWRDATPEDAIKEPPMVARFRHEDAEDWEYDLLVGWDRTDQWHWRSELYSFECCQVYDAPDPGEGWRLIDPEKEQPEEHDEYLCPTSKFWCFCTEYLARVSYSKDAIVRRRTEQPKPKYVPFEWEDREQLRGRWITREKDGYVIEEIAYRFDSRAFEVVAKNLLQDWHFVDTGEPVGKRV